MTSPESASPTREGAVNLERGALLAGKYQVEGVIGRGGMGVVVAARHLALDELVAIKVLEPRDPPTASMLARFRREGRTAARIKSEHVGRILDVDALPDGTPYIVMEYLTGADLATELSRRGPLPLDESLSLLLQACEAVAAAHAAGVVHRDLKPGNLFLAARQDGSRIVKILDFGISKVTDPGDPGSLEVTTAFETLGSPVYMSPEQMRSSRDVDGRTDIWSLGVILYRMLTGKVPFPGTTVTDVCARILTDPTPSVLVDRPELPKAVDAVVARCLAKEPGGRFGSVAELALSLGPLAPSEAARVARIATSQPPVLIEGDEQGGAPVFLGDGAPVDRGATTIVTEDAAVAAPTVVPSSLQETPGAPSPSAARRGPGTVFLVVALGVAAAALALALRSGDEEGTQGATVPLPAPSPSLPALAVSPVAVAPTEASNKPPRAAPVPSTDPVVATSSRTRPSPPRPGARRPVAPPPAPPPPPPPRKVDENPLHL